MDLIQFLQQQFNKKGFRPGQQESLEAALMGQNVLTILPTGGGKSLIYQFLAQSLNEGCVLVISPLVALIDDQYKQAQDMGVAVGKVHSGLSASEKESFYQKAPHLRLLMMTPERLLQDKMWEALQNINVKYLVIDEAHCLSQWGHDFRPDYTRIPEFRKRLGEPPVIALTATATQRVKDEILNCLDPQKKQSWFQYQASIFRPNLHLQVYSAHGDADKLRRLTAWAHAVPGSQIVYFSLVQSLERISGQLEKMGVRHTKYHGQLPSHLKQKNQKLFFNDQQPLILATPAFGLGVNKPNIRSVLHFEMPQSIEAYFQEVGRAGRDGEQSWAEVFYDPDDVSIHMDFLKWNHPEPDFIYSLFRLIKEHPQRFVQEGADFLREKLNFYNKRDFRAETALNLLKRWDLLHIEKGQVTTAALEALNKIPDLDKNLQQQRKKSAQLRLLDLVQLLEKYKTEEPPQTSQESIQLDIVDYFLKGAS